MDDDIFRQSWPGFLRIIDSDPDGAMARSYRQLSRYVEVATSWRIRQLSTDDKKEFLHNLFVYLHYNDSEKIRKYRDHGKPFAGWLNVVAIKFAISIWKKPIDPDPDPEPTPGPVDPLAKEAVQECLSWIGEKKQLYRELLEMWSHGYKPREMIEPLGYEPGENKKVFNHLKQAKEWIAQCLRKKGIRKSDVY